MRRKIEKAKPRERRAKEAANTAEYPNDFPMDEPTAGPIAQATVYARPSRPTPVPIRFSGTTREAKETTMVDLNAKAKPCKARQTPNAMIELLSAHPSAEAEKSPHDMTRSVRLLSLSEIAPLTGRIAKADVASNPAKNPAIDIDAPRESE